MQVALVSCHGKLVVVYNNEVSRDDCIYLNIYRASYIKVRWILWKFYNMQVICLNEQVLWLKYSIALYEHRLNLYIPNYYVFKMSGQCCIHNIWPLKDTITIKKLLIKTMSAVSAKQNVYSMSKIILFQQNSSV